MALSAKISRARLTERLNQLEPSILKAAADAKLQIAEDGAEAIRKAAEARFGTGDYSRIIVGERQDANPNKKAFGNQQTKDPDATGIYAKWIWRFLEFGTAPHNISKGGGTKKGKSIGPQHPGTRAQPHIFPTWRSMKKKARAKMLRAINKAVKQAMGK